MRKPLCGIRRAGGVLADERDLPAGDRIAVLLHVEFDAVVHLRGWVCELARITHDQTDLQRLLRVRSTKAVADQQTAKTQNCLSHYLLPIVSAAALTLQPYHKPQRPALTSAADLKFLQHLQQTLLGTSNRKAALESESCQCPFVSEVRVRAC